MAQRDLRQFSDDALFTDWVAWIKRVKQELIALAWNRRMYREVSKIFEHNPHLLAVGGFVFEWLQLNYTAGAAMSLRREVDRAQHMGFVHLLEEIAERPHILSRQRYYDVWGPLTPGADADMRREMFERAELVRYQDEPMRDHLAPASVCRDIDQLKKDTKIVHDYVEQTIAHRTRGTPEPITFAAFHAAVDSLTPILTKYYARLTLSVLMEIEPTPQYNAHEPFTFPWDVTCDQMWQEFTTGKRLPWNQIDAVYESDDADPAKAK